MKNSQKEDEQKPTLRIITTTTGKSSAIGYEECKENEERLRKESNSKVLRMLKLKS